MWSCQCCHLSSKAPQQSPKGGPRWSQREPKDPKGSPKGVKGIKKGGTKQTKVPPKPPFEPQGTQQGPKGNPKWSQGEPKDPKGSPQGVKGTPREDKIAHRRSKIAKIYENTMAFHYFLKSQRARILKMCVSRRRNDYFFGKLLFRVHEIPTF